MKEALVTQVENTHSIQPGGRLISAAHTRGCATCLTGLRSFDDVSCTADAHRAHLHNRFWCRNAARGGHPHGMPIAWSQGIAVAWRRA